MEKDALLTEILLPQASGWRSAYLKLRRRGSFDFPILGVAAALRFHEDGTVADARLTLGAVASHPVEVNEVASQLLHQPAQPRTERRGSSGYGQTRAAGIESVDERSQPSIISRYPVG